MVGISEQFEIFKSVDPASEEGQLWMISFENGIIDTANMICLH